MANAKIPFILVIEDNADYARGLQIFLQGEGFTTRWAEDVAHARQALDEVRPDLIILDISLPDENGIEYCRRLKRSPSTTDIPIIMLSAHLEMATFLAESEQGAERYLEKDLRYDEILSHIRDLLRPSTRK